MMRNDSVDGRWYRWVLWAVLVVPYIVVYFHRLAVGVLQTELMTEFGLSATGFANIGAAYFYTYAVLQIPAGILSDTLGPRRTVAVSTAITAAGGLVFALAGSADVLFLGRLVVGVGVSTVYVAILKVLAQWFDEGEFASMAGLTGMVGTLGGLMAQQPLFWASQRWGWRAVFVGVAILSAVSAVVCYLVVREGGPSANRETRGTRTGYGARGAAASGAASMASAASGAASAASAAGAATAAAHETHLLRELGATVSNWRTWPPWFLFGGVFGSIVALTGTFGQRYLTDVLGLPPTRASNMLTLTVACFAVGQVLFAMFSDRVRRRRLPMVVLSAVCAVLWAVMASGLAGPGVGLYVLMILLAFSSGVMMCSLPCGKEVNHPDFSGTSTAVVNMGGFVGSAVVPLLMGRVLDALLPAGSAAVAYRWAWMVCVGAVTVGFVAALFITETRCRNVYFELQARRTAGAATKRLR